MKRAGVSIVLSIYLFTFSQCHLFSCKKKEIAAVKEASAYPYTSAMGKGRGVIFRIKIPVTSKQEFTVDSFYVNGSPLSFSTTPTDSIISVEALHYRDIPEPALNSDGLMQTTELVDPIIMQGIYDPSYLIVKQNGHSKKIVIHHYTIQSEPH